VLSGRGNRNTPLPPQVRVRQRCRTHLRVFGVTSLLGLHAQPDAAGDHDRDHDDDSGHNASDRATIVAMSLFLPMLLFPMFIAALRCNLDSICWRRRFSRGADALLRGAFAVSDVLAADFGVGEASLCQFRSPGDCRSGSSFCVCTTVTKSSGSVTTAPTLHTAAHGCKIVKCRPSAAAPGR